MDVQPARHGFGLYGEDFGYPGGGLCLSVFLAVERDGELLVGQMAEDEEATWIDRWAPNVAFYEGKRRQALFDGWRLPATYLRVGEAPEAAARRVWGDQLGFDTDVEPGDVTVFSGAQPSNRSPEHEHWDIVFAYRVQGPPAVSSLAHWAELGYRSPTELDPEASVMMHGQMLDELASVS